MIDDFKHCDDYIDDETQPECLRTFLEYARSPAHGAFAEGPRPRLFADYKGERVRVVMASRFGDVGITSVLHAEHGYDRRVAVDDLTNFGTRRKRDSGSDRNGENSRSEVECEASQSGLKGIAQTPGETP